MQETIELYDYFLVHSTARAYLVRDEQGEEYWVPKSLVEHIEFGEDMTDEEEKPVKEIVRFTIPEWFVEQEGLV